MLRNIETDLGKIVSLAFRFKQHFTFSSKYQIGYDENIGQIEIYICKVRLNKQNNALQHIDSENFS